MCSNSPRVLGNPVAGLPFAMTGVFNVAFMIVARELCSRTGKRCCLK